MKRVVLLLSDARWLDDEQTLRVEGFGEDGYEFIPSEMVESVEEVPS